MWVCGREPAELAPSSVSRPTTTRPSCLATLMMLTWPWWTMSALMPTYTSPLPAHAVAVQTLSNEDAEGG